MIRKLLIVLMLFSAVAMSQNSASAGASAQDAPASTDQVYKIGGDVLRPKPIYTPDAEYSEAARKARISGSVQLDVVVGKDGAISDAKVEKSLGYGLDEQALATVKTWKFEPATKNGVAVPVRIRVMMNFRMYMR